MFTQSQNVAPGAHSWGAVFATLCGLFGVLMPFVPPQYQLVAQAAVAGIAAAATKLP